MSALIAIPAGLWTTYWGFNIIKNILRTLNTGKLTFEYFNYLPSDIISELPKHLDIATIRNLALTCKKCSTIINVKTLMSLALTDTYWKFSLVNWEIFDEYIKFSHDRKKVNGSLLDHLYPSKYAGTRPEIITTRNFSTYMPIFKCRYENCNPSNFEFGVYVENLLYMFHFSYNYTTFPYKPDIYVYLYPGGRLSLGDPITSMRVDEISDPTNTISIKVDYEENSITYNVDATSITFIPTVNLRKSNLKNLKIYPMLKMTSKTNIQII